MDEKGFYKYKLDREHIVCVYDVTHCIDDHKVYYSYIDPHNGSCVSMSKENFLKCFER